LQFRRKIKMATDDIKTAEATATAQPTAQPIAEATATAQPTAQPTKGVDPNIVDQDSLSIGDLKNLATIIDIASSRGAFRANEMASIGLMYNKLQGFVTKVNPGTAPITVPPTTTEGK
jgi:hypothetical protein